MNQITQTTLKFGNRGWGISFSEIMRQIVNIFSSRFLTAITLNNFRKCLSVLKEKDKLGGKETYQTKQIKVFCYKKLAAILP